MSADPRRVASPSGTGGTARCEWEKAYDLAVQWRDWQTCEMLIDEREQADWYTPEIVAEHEHRGFKLSPIALAANALRKALRVR